MPGSTAAILVSAGFLVVWLLPDVRGFRPVLARGWHDQLGRTVMTIFGVSCANKHAGEKLTLLLSAVDYW